MAFAEPPYETETRRFVTVRQTVNKLGAVEANTRRGKHLIYSRMRLDE